MAGLFVNINYIVVPIFLMLSDANKALGVSFFPGQQIPAVPDICLQFTVLFHISAQRIFQDSSKRI